MAANIHSVQVLEDLRAALSRLRSQADEMLAAATQQIRHDFEWLAERQQHGQIEVRRCEEGVRQAEAAVARCQASGTYDRDGRYCPPNCTVPERVLAQSRARLRAAEAELKAVHQWNRRVQETAADYQKQAQRLAAMLSGDLPNATALLGRKIDDLHAYASISGSAGRHGQSFDWTSSTEPSVAAGESRRDAESGSPLLDLPIDDLFHLGQTDSEPERRESVTWVDQGIREVPISGISVTDSPVQSAEDFREVSAGEMQMGLQKLAEVVRPAVESGHGGDYFSQLDSAQGLAYEHGYRRVYDAFYGHDSIRLEYVGDWYIVVNGYHRLHVARQLGWITIPARVIAPEPGSPKRSQPEVWDAEPGR